MAHHEAQIATKNEEKFKGRCLGMRHVQALLLFLNISVLCMNRSHPAITLVAMTNADKANPDFPEYDWNEQQKSYILSSFYLGYFWIQIPSGMCVRSCGVKFSLFTFTFGMGILTVIMPYCISWGGWQAFCVLRFIQGVWQGAYYPATMQHLAQWTPPKERSLIGGAVHTGFDCGALVAMGICGLIAPSYLGWPGVFYISGGLCFIWCLLWLILGANNVSDTCCITKSELNYIEHAMKDKVNLQKKRTPVPWAAVLRSKSFYAIFIARAASLASYVTMEAEWPAFSNAILNMNIEENSLYSALPSLFGLVSVFIFLFIAHFVEKRNCMSLTAMRKMFNSIGLWGSALPIFVIGFLDERHKMLAIVMRILIHFLHSSSQLGTAINILDIAPNHADVITAFGNTFTYFIIFLGPLFFGWVVRNEQNSLQWRIAFTVLALMLCVGDIAFLILGTAKEQAWNATDFKAKQSDKQKIEDIAMASKAESKKNETETAQQDLA